MHRRATAGRAVGAVGATFSCMPAAKLNKMPAAAEEANFVGWRSALASRFFLDASDDHSATFAHLSEPERTAFMHGYLMATRDMMLVIGTAIATLAFCFACFSPALHLPLRRLVRPWTLRHVAGGRWLIEAVQRHTRHPALRGTRRGRRGAHSAIAGVCRRARGRSGLVAATHRPMGGRA